MLGLAFAVGIYGQLFILFEIFPGEAGRVAQAGRHH